jgi:hypothetical protein
VIYRPRHKPSRTVGVRSRIDATLRAWLDAEPDHREALDLIHDLSRWAGYLAAVTVRVAASTGGLGAAARYEREVSEASQRGSRRGLAGVSALIRGAQ